MWSAKMTTLLVLIVLIIFTDPYFTLFSALYFSNRLKYFSDTFSDYITGQHGVSHAGMVTLL